MALVPIWFVPVVGGYGMVVCACSSGDPGHRVTINTDSLGPIVPGEGEPPPSARSHREFQQTALAIACRLKQSVLSWAAVAQGIAESISPSLLIWTKINEDAVSTTLAFESLDENKALIDRHSVGGVAAEVQADGAWHQAGNSSNRGMVTAVAVDNKYPGGLIVGNVTSDMTTTPHQVGLGMPPKWSKKAKAMEPAGMKVVLQGALNRGIRYGSLTIDGDSTALKAVAPIVLEMNPHLTALALTMAETVFWSAGAMVSNCLNHYLKARIKKLHDAILMKGKKNGNPKSLHLTMCAHRRIELKGGGFGKHPK